MNIVEMTCRDIFGELVISKITNYKPEPISILYDKKDKLILFHCNENLSVFYNENNENNEIIKIKTENKSNCDNFFDDLLEIIKK
jgi:hypothetical protein